MYSKGLILERRSRINADRNLGRTDFLGGGIPIYRLSQASFMSRTEVHNFGGIRFHLVDEVWWGAAFYLGGVVGERGGAFIRGHCCRRLVY